MACYRWQCSYGNYLDTCWDCTFTQSSVHEAAWLECSCDTNTGISERIAKNLSKKPTTAPNHILKSVHKG